MDVEQPYCGRWDEKLVPAVFALPYTGVFFSMANLPKLPPSHSRDSLMPYSNSISISKTVALRKSNKIGWHECFLAAAQNLFIKALAWMDTLLNTKDAAIPENPHTSETNEQIDDKSCLECSKQCSFTHNPLLMQHAKTDGCS